MLRSLGEGILSFFGGVAEGILNAFGSSTKLLRLHFEKTWEIIHHDAKMSFLKMGKAVHDVFFDPVGTGSALLADVFGSNMKVIEGKTRLYNGLMRGNYSEMFSGITEMLFEFVKAAGEGIGETIKGAARGVLALLTTVNPLLGAAAKGVVSNLEAITSQAAEVDEQTKGWLETSRAAASEAAKTDKASAEREKARAKRGMLLAKLGADAASEKMTQHRAEIGFWDQQMAAEEKAHCEELKRIDDLEQREKDRLDREQQAGRQARQFSRKARDEHLEATLATFGKQAKAEKYTRGQLAAGERAIRDYLDSTTRTLVQQIREQKTTVPEAERALIMARTEAIKQAQDAAKRVLTAQPGDVADRAGAGAKASAAAPVKVIVTRGGRFTHEITLKGDGPVSRALAATANRRASSAGGQ
jgi:hypothetical protein